MLTTFKIKNRTDKTLHDALNIYNIVYNINNLYTQ